MKHYFIFSCLFISCSVFAQQSTKTLEQRWKKMLENAETYEPYKVINKTELLGFWKSASDSLVAYERTIRQDKIKARAQALSIANLKKELEEQSALLVTAKIESDSLTFLGLTANKYVYLSFLYLLLFIALVAGVFLYYFYQKSKVVADEKILLFQKISQEFNEFKQAKFDIEKKLKRDLQTHMNTIEELKRAH